MFLLSSFSSKPLVLSQASDFHLLWFLFLFSHRWPPSPSHWESLIWSRTRTSGSTLQTDIYPHWGSAHVVGLKSFKKSIHHEVVQGYHLATMIFYAKFFCSLSKSCNSSSWCCRKTTNFNFDIWLSNLISCLKARWTLVICFTADIRLNGKRDNPKK